MRAVAIEVREVVAVLGEAGIVESYISYLRRKIDPVAPPLIHTKRGVGYVLRLPPS